MCDKEFNELVPSTRTIISVLNINIDIEKIFEEIETVEYNFVETKRGRRKKNERIDRNQNIPDGSIISLTYENKVKGNIKKKKNNVKFFRNTLTIVMMYNNKLMNFKIFTAKENTGNKTQHPGCKDIIDAENVLLNLWNNIKDKKECYSFVDQEKELSIIFHTVMTNINFNLGFVINRQKLNESINKFENYNSMLETNIGHAGTNITQNIDEKIVIDDLPRIKLKEDGKVERDTVTFDEYLNKLSEKQRNIQLKKNRKNTFLVFYSGKTIMSGFITKYMEEPYYDFNNIIKEIREDIEEKNLV